MKHRNLARGLALVFGLVIMAALVVYVKIAPGSSGELELGEMLSTDIHSESEIVEDPELSQVLETTWAHMQNYSYGDGVTIMLLDDERTIISNGIPEHETGTFPNAGNPNRISAQSHSYTVDATPAKNSNPTPTQLAGVALNGIPLEPGTAETWNNDRNWSIEAFDAGGVGGLGIDWSNAHVQPNGTYHYHAEPSGLIQSALSNQSGDLIHLAWAADGFPIYFSQSDTYTPSYRVKGGSRSSGPGGSYDGTYTQDFEYVKGLGDLDECNGITIEGEYIYLMTNTFPYIQRCTMGTPDPSFEKGPGGAGPNAGGQTPAGITPPGTQQNANAGGPPQSAIDACASKSPGSSCSMQTPRGNLSGTCRITPENSTACVPN